jgi:hypothetical protein
MANPNKDEKTANYIGMVIASTTAIVFSYWIIEKFFKKKS